jgi:hypothetical protein
MQIAAKNGVYITLVRDVRAAFEGSPLVKVDCKGMEPSDYKKLGAKLKVINESKNIVAYKVRDKMYALKKKMIKTGKRTFTWKPPANKSYVKGNLI